MKPIITPAQKKALEAALYDLSSTENEVEVLKAAGVDMSEPETLRADLKKSLMAYLAYAQQQGKS
jgi:hypothetical protein